MQTLRTVRNPFTAALIDFEVTQPPFWMATEYVPGPTLAQAVRAYGPQLIDFGIAQAEDQDGLTELGMTIGIPGHLAPEVIVDQQNGPAADVFALRATLAFAGTGRPPYGTGSVHTINTRCIEGTIDLDGLPADLAALVRDCVNRDPAQRPLPEQIVERCQTRSALLETPAYQRIIAEQKQTFDEPETVLAPAPRRSRPGRLAAAVVVAGVLLGTGSWFAFTQADDAPSATAEPSTLNVPGGNCLSVPDTFANGDIPTVQPCDGFPAQQWEFTPEGLLKGQDRCLDVGIGELGNGTGAKLWDCNGTEAQRFADRNGEISTWLPAAA